ncbi:hypothetical protein BJX64DRAFT_95106 [Aspergillus heterothallicus]
MPPTSRKSSPEQQRALLAKYRISIDGPLRPRDWPEKYASIFGLVRDAEKLRYEDYYRTDVGNDIPRRVQVAQMSNRVEELVSRAYSLRMSLANEETWRMETENLVLQRFKAELDCHVCNNRRWLSDIQALPSCPRASEKLQRIRSVRALCRCEEPARAKWLVESTSPQSIKTHASCTVTDTSMLEIQNKVLAHHRPDRVLSLGRTYDLNRLLDANPDIAPTVIKSDIHSCFPFLVLEAKSEKGTVGFESIERQTAFPIRAMLGIQKSLETGVDLPQILPLVWFLANRGDEWRVYGCVPDRTRVRVIDLWHGCILRHDSSLQLLLIIDLICDWARDVFAEQVMSSLRQRANPGYLPSVAQSSFEEIIPSETGLARDSAVVRSLSPSEGISEEASNTNARFEAEIKIEPPSAFSASREATRTDGEVHTREFPTLMTNPEILANSPAETSLSIEPESTADREITATTIDGTGTHGIPHGLTPAANPERADHHSGHEQSNMSERATETQQTDNAVNGASVHADSLGGETSVPTLSAEHRPEQPRGAAPKTKLNDRDTWATYVVRSDANVRLRFASIYLPESTRELDDMLKILGRANTADTAREILSLFNWNDPFIVESGYINRLSKAWGQNIGDKPHKPRNLFACLIWRARFDYEDWTVHKELFCIAATRGTIEALAAAGKIATAKECLQQKLELTIRANRLIHPVRYLPIAELVQAAARSKCLHLKASNGHAAPSGWTEDHRKTQMLQHILDRFELQRFGPAHRPKPIVATIRSQDGIQHMTGARKDINVPYILQAPEFAKERGMAILKRPNGIETDEAEFCVFAFDQSHRSLSVLGESIKSFLQEGHSCYYGTDQQLSAGDRKTLARWADALPLLLNHTVKRRRYV